MPQDSHLSQAERDRRAKVDLARSLARSLDGISDAGRDYVEEHLRCRLKVRTRPPRASSRPVAMAAEMLRRKADEALERHQAIEASKRRAGIAE